MAVYKGYNRKNAETKTETIIKNTIMELFYIQEHLSCHHYANDKQAGFRYIEAPQRIFFTNEILQLNYLVFILEGKLEISSEYFNKRTIIAGEFFFLSKGQSCSAYALEDIKIIIHKYDRVTHLCDKFTFMDLKKYSKKEYSFAPLGINPTLNAFLDLILTYLKAGANCIHLHTIKQEELFWILRATYKKEILADLFHLSIGNSLEFRYKVLDFYKTAGTAQELARLCGYSRQQFNKLFLEEFGIPPYVWMKKRIMIHIRARLADREVQLNDIVDEFNLSSLPHLIRLCKSHFGKTPIELRNEIIVEQMSPYKFKTLQE